MRCTKFAPRARGFAISAAALAASVGECAANGLPWPNGFVKIDEPLLDEALENGCGGRCLKKLRPNGALLPPLDLFRRKPVGDAIDCLCVPATSSSVGWSADSALNKSSSALSTTIFSFLWSCSDCAWCTCTGRKKDCGQNFELFVCSSFCSSTV